MKQFLLQITILFFCATHVWADDGNRGGMLTLPVEIVKNLLTVDASRVVISGTNRLVSSQVMDILNDGKNESRAPIDIEDDRFYFWDLATENVTSRLLADPWIINVKTKWRVFPLVAEFIITEQQPYAVAEFYNESWLVSKEGEIIESLSSTVNPQVIVEASKLPRLIGIDELEDKSTTYASAGSRLEYALAFFKMLQEQTGHLPFSIESITLLDDGTFLVTPFEIKKYPKIVFPFDKQFNFFTAAKKIDAIVQDSQRRGKRLSQLDFRHNYVIAK